MSTQLDARAINNSILIDVEFLGATRSQLVSVEAAERFVSKIQLAVAQVRKQQREAASTVGEQ